MSLAARRSAAAESLVEARPAEFGVGDDRTVEVRLAEVRLLVHFATLVCYFATFLVKMAPEMKAKFDLSPLQLVGQLIASKISRRGKFNSDSGY